MIRSNKKYIGLLSLSILLASCNTTGINANHPNDVNVNTVRYNSIQVYNKRADLPRGTKIIGRVTAQNYLPNGIKASPENIITELKRQAAIKGGNGIVFVTPGTVQTTANAVRTPLILN